MEKGLQICGAFWPKKTFIVVRYSQNDVEVYCTLETVFAVYRLRVDNLPVVSWVQGKLPVSYVLTGNLAAA